MFDLYSKKIPLKYIMPFCTESELSGDDKKNQDTENLLRHEPWFSFVQKGIEKAEFYEDVVLANNCLTEMSPRALAFYLKVLEKGSDSPIWICQGFGGRRILTKSLIWHAQEVILSFAVAGFYLSFFGPSSNSGDLPFAIFTKKSQKGFALLAIEITTAYRGT